METELKKYKVISEFSSPAIEAVEASEGVEAVEAQPEVVFEVGQEIEMTEDSAAPLVKEGVLELLVEEKITIPAENLKEAVGSTGEAVSVPKKYMGKDIISDSIEVVNEKEYHSLMLADGSKHLLNHAEYDELNK